MGCSIYLHFNILAIITSSIQATKVDDDVAIGSGTNDITAIEVDIQEGQEPSLLPVDAVSESEHRIRDLSNASNYDFPKKAKKKKKKNKADQPPLADSDRMPTSIPISTMMGKQIILDSSADSNSAASLDIEKKHVFDVYDDIAVHWHHTRGIRKVSIIILYVCVAWLL